MLRITKYFSTITDWEKLKTLKIGIRQILYSPSQSKKLTKGMYNNLINTILK